MLTRALHRLPAMRVPTKRALCGYLYRSIDNAIVSEHRQRLARIQTEASGTDLDESADRAADLAEHVATADLAGRLLAGLTEEQRNVMRLRFFDDLSLEETAARTGKPVTAVKALQRRALRSMRVAALAATTLSAPMVVGRLAHHLPDDPWIDPPALDPSGQEPTLAAASLAGASSTAAWFALPIILGYLAFAEEDDSTSWVRLTEEVA